MAPTTRAQMRIQVEESEPVEGSLASQWFVDYGFGRVNVYRQGGIDFRSRPLTPRCWTVLIILDGYR